MFFDSLSGLGRVVLISILAYVALVVTLRVSGKRTLAKLNAFDLVVTVALGSTLATILLSKDVALAEGVLAFVMLACLQWLVARLSLTSPWVRDAVRSALTLLLEDGVFRDDAMRRERIVENEVRAAIRTAGHGRIEDIAAVVLETDGSLSVIARNPTCAPLSALGDVAR